jgi:hypothetical protein
MFFIKAFENNVRRNPGIVRVLFEPWAVALQKAAGTVVFGNAAGTGAVSQNSSYPVKQRSIERTKIDYEHVSRGRLR